MLPPRARVVEPVLAIEGLRAGYAAGVPIVQDVTLSVQAEELVAVFGPNGAGKSTLAKAVAGTVGTFGGRVRFGGVDITGWPAWRIARAGLAYVPQRGNVFAELSVRENLELGAAARGGRGAVGIDAVLALFPALAGALGRRAGVLSGGTRQMVAVGRALLAAPRLMLLDEPTAGLSPAMAGEVLASLGALKQRVAILLVEQNVVESLGIASRAYVLANGRITLSGRADDLAENPELEKTYLGM